MSAEQRSICVFCGSSPGNSPVYLAAAKALGQALAQNKYQLVYGGGERGCMGAVASSVLENGGKVLGVIPRVMTTKPTGHPTASDSTTHSTEGSGHQTLEVGGASQIQANLKTVVVETMHERKQTMSSASDGFIGLPGGFGTFEEVMEMITWSQLGIHNKPVVLVNTNGFWEPIRQMIDLAVRDGFISEKGRSLVRIVGKEGEDASVIAAQAIQQFGQELKQLGERGAGYWDWNKKPVTGDAVMADVNGDAPKAAKELAVTVPNLTFAFTKGGEPALEDCNLFLERGSRCLLIGANGAGKSTLLRILAGKRLCDSSVRIFGRDVFRDSPRGITYLGTEWAMNPVVRSDIVVSHFLDSVGGYRHKERRDRLLNILDVDLDWHMHQISDGERRRVQLCMGLMEPWDLLLLDEVTVDLDVQVRSDLLEFLMEETEARNATIIYATHIFDGLQTFPTHLVHMRLGSTTTKEPFPWPPTKDNAHLLPAIPNRPESDASGVAGDDFSPLLHIALIWLREDKKHRAEKETQLGRKRGARTAAETTDSEKFFSKFDYSH